MNDVYSIETKYGKVIITRNTIGKIVLDAVKAKKGKVYLSNHKGKSMGFLSRKLSGMEEISNIDISFNNNKIEIKLYVIVKFGISISKITNEIIEQIEKDIVEFCDEPPESIIMVVTGTISKKIAKRHIEVMKRYGDN